jgi:uncharacterized protein (DUF885 family)
MSSELARRDLLVGAGTLGITTCFPAMAQGGTATDNGAGDKAFLDQLETFTQEVLRQAPESATQLGLDHGALASLRGELSHTTPAALEQGAASVRSIRDRLTRTNRAELSLTYQNRYDSLLYSLDRGLEAARFSYGGGALAGLAGGTFPYVVSQQNSAVITVPDLLVSSHEISNHADAEAYTARIAAFARLIDEETAAIRADAARGIMPPKFIADNAVGILKGFRATPAAKQSLVTNLVTKTRALGVATYGDRAENLMETMVYPALEREIAALTAATAQAPMIAGVQRLPDGEAYYRWALRLGTTTSYGPQEIHAIGLAQNEEVKARMDALLRAQGLTQGSVGERAGVLSRDPRQLYPDTDQGRAELIAQLNQRIGDIRAMMPRLSHLGLKADVIVKRVPPDIQDGAPRGYMMPAPLDGSRPAQYYLNLKSTAMWPRYQLASVTAHEGIPGHTWQLAYLAEHHAQLPSISSVIGYNAFVEGWALYAEQLVDEEGLYAQDPWSRLGYLQAQQFRACRLVVDTGLHALGWSREKAIDFLVSETGQGRLPMTSEIDRYCSMPGQACGYKMGHNEILRLREKARKALGSRFDLAGYDDAVVTCGGVPLELLEGVIDRYIERATRDV